jgi:hypothetical protein
VEDSVVASIFKEVTVNAPPLDCWDALRDFAALHERLAREFITDTKMVGDGEREVTFFSGAVAREKLVGIDDEQKRLAYTVVEGSLGSSHHNASAQVVPIGEQRCRFVWITDVLPDDLAAPIAGLMDAGLQAIKKTLESRLAV